MEQQTIASAPRAETDEEIKARLMRSARELAQRIAARDIADPAAAAAARAAGHAAASAFTHPLADVRQTVHIVGSAAYAALALELDRGGNPDVGEAEVRRAVAHAPPEVGDVLRRMPPRSPGKSRLAMLLYRLDAALRGSCARR